MKGKVALVTGGTSGIGEAAASAFAAAGARVVIASRGEAQAAAALQRLEPRGEVSWIRADVSKPADVRDLVRRTIEKLGRIDYAFNNAGSGGRMAPVADMDEADWNSTIGDFLTGVWLCMKYEIREMLKTGGGVIVNNSSVDGLRGFPFPGGAAYSAAKHGVIGLTKSAALEYVAKGIRINAICPGWVATPPVEGYMRHDPAAARELVSQEPIGRLAAPQEIADAVLWLCSERASFVVGTALAVDGGYLA